MGGTFDTELISQGWEADIKLPPGSDPGASNTDDESPTPTQEPSAIAQYEQWCRDPNSGGLAVVESAMSDGQAVGVESDDPQDFLERQLKILEAFKAKAPEKGGSPLPAGRRVEFPEEKSVHDHIGPVQFNMGGIQVDADDMLQRLKVSLPFKLLIESKCNQGGKAMLMTTGSQCACCARRRGRTGRTAGGQHGKGI